VNTINEMKTPKDPNGQPLQNQQPPADSIHGGGTAADAAARGISSIFGKWPGDETDEQIDAALKARNEGGGK